MRVTIVDMQTIAKKKGGKCLSPAYVNSHTKLAWQCKNGHQWETTPAHIKQGRWCPICAGIQIGTIEEMQQIARQRGGECLSNRYINNYYKLTWQCREGHQWEAVPASVKQGYWCSACSRVLKGTIEEMRTIAETRGGQCLSDTYVDSSTKVDWRCEVGHQWKAIPARIKQGTWCPVCAGKQKCTIEDMNKMAKKRGGECLSREYTNSNTKLIWRCGKGHQWQSAPVNITRGKWCPVCSGRQKGTIEGMSSIAARHGGQCVSERYISSQRKLTWKCKEGHQWETTPAHIKQGSWCPVCAGIQKGSIEEMQQIAALYGGKCLSDEYVNNYSKLKWQCEHGHQWEAVPGSVSRGSWCPSCTDRRKHSGEAPDGLAIE
jgi:hypothetical protein